MRRQICACVLDYLPGWRLAIGLNLELNKIEQGMRLSVAGEADLAVAEQLLPDDVAQSVVLLLNSNCCKIHQFLTLLIFNPFCFL